MQDRGLYTQRKRLEYEEKYELLFLFSLSLVTFILRLVVFIFWVDSPGDGPIRAMLAYQWSRSPYIATHGVWLPGFTYLSGIFSFIVNDPLVSTRILNVIVGTLTVPLFYLLVRRVYSHTVAVLSASILTFLPLHIGLSASSLTETSFLFEIIAGTVYLIKAAERTKDQALHLSLSLLCLSLAAMTRYEAWPLIPLFLPYYFWETRKKPTTIFMAITLLIFPVAWLLGNYLHTGDFLPSFYSTTKMGPAAVGAHQVDLFNAVGIIYFKLVSHLGWILLIAIVWGITMQLTQATRGRSNSERILYILMTGIFFTFMLCFAMFRGSSLFDRYLLFGVVLILPFAALPPMHYLGNHPRWLGLAICIALVSIEVSQFFHHPRIYVTRRQPTEIKKVVDWLRKSPYYSAPILLTEMNGHASYLPLYFPEVSSRQLTVSFWTKDSRLSNFLKTQQPHLLITRDGDNKAQSLIEDFLEKKIHKDRLVLSEGAIKVYVLKP